MVLGAMVYRAVRWYVNFGLWGAGDHIYCHLFTSCAPCDWGNNVCCSWTFWISQGSTSNDHYIAQNDSSSPTLPTNSDILCKIGNASDCYSVRFMHCNFRTHIRGACWSTAIWCKLPLCAIIAGIAITSLHFAHAPTLRVRFALAP